MQLLWTSFTYLLKNVEHGTKHVVNGALEVCLHYTLYISQLYSRFYEYLSI